MTKHQRKYTNAKKLWDIIMVRLDKEDGAFLRTFARNQGVPLTEAVRYFIYAGMSSVKKDGYL